MRLAELQQAFQAHVVAGDPAILATTGARGERGLRVYAHAYRATLSGALRDAFPRTAAWLGDEAFDAAVDDYVATVRPASWTLGAYGDRFAATLGAGRPDDPEIGELAWLEWRLREAFSAPDARPIAPETFADVDWERARLGFHPAVAARMIVADVAGLWHAMGEERAPGRVLLPVTAGVIVWRDALQPRFRTTSAAEAEALAALIGGASFAEAAVLAGDPATAGGWLARWLADELVTVAGAVRLDQGCNPGAHPIEYQP